MIVGGCSESMRGGAGLGGEFSFGFEHLTYITSILEEWRMRQICEPELRAED